jgi:hypothetical protein
MARYIEGYCDQQMPPPYRFQDVTIWGFPVLADLRKVQETVDRFLGSAGDSLEVLQGAAGTPAAGATIVYVLLLDYGKMSCIDPPESTWGYTSQKELYTGIVLVRLLPPEVVLFVPYIFVDNPWSMISGNMVVGYPKQQASFQMGAGPAAPYPVRVDSLVFPRYSPGTPLQSRPVAEIVQAAQIAPGGGPAVSPFGDLAGLFGQDGVLPVDAAMLAALQSGALSYRIMQLKQVRSAQKPDEACYRAIVSGKVTIESILPGAGLLPAAKVHFGSYASSDIGQALGLGTDSALPFRLRCNFTLGDVQERTWS